MNNKGQVLPIFVILFPIIILIISYIVDIGIMYTEKRKIENITKDAVSYYIDNKDNIDVYDKTFKLLNKNIKNSNISISIEEEYVIIHVSKTHSSLYNIINLNNEIIVTYKGNLSNKRIVKGLSYGIK